MAGDWIKIEHTLPAKSEVRRMAVLLKKSEREVVGALVALWIWADQHSIGGDVSLDEAGVDKQCGLRGFAGALRSVGWLEGEDWRLVFPNFKRHNGSTAKARSETNRRVAEHRARNGNVTGSPLQKALPEKRREENTDTHPQGAGGLNASACPAPGKQRGDEHAAELPSCLPQTEEAARNSLQTAGIPPDALARYWLDIASRGGRDGAGQPVTNWGIYAKKRHNSHQHDKHEKGHHENNRTARNSAHQRTSDDRDRDRTGITAKPIKTPLL